jgi:hypothetical protein
VGAGAGLNDHGCDHSSLCVFRARLLAHHEEGKLFQGIVARAVEPELLPKRAVQVMDSSPMLGAAAVQDTYKLLRTGLHKLVKGHKGELPKELMPQLKRYLQTGKPDIDWENREARQRELQQLVEDAELALRELPAESDKPVARTARALLEQVAHQDVERGGKGRVQIRQWPRTGWSRRSIPRCGTGTSPRTQADASTELIVAHRLAAVLVHFQTQAGEFVKDLSNLRQSLSGANARQPCRPPSLSCVRGLSRSPASGSANSSSVSPSALRMAIERWRKSFC